MSDKEKITPNEEFPSFQPLEETLPESPETPSEEASEQVPGQTPEETLDQTFEEPFQQIPEELPTQAPEETLEPAAPPTPTEAAVVAPLPPAPPPAPRPPQRRPQRQRRSVSPGVRASVIVAFVILLILGISSLVQLFTLYDIRLTSTPEGLRFELERRIRAEDILLEPGRTPTPAPPPASTPSVSPAELETPDTVGDGSPMPTVTLGTGVILELHPTPDEDELSFREIFERCSPSVVLVEVHALFGSAWGSGTGVIMTEDGYIITSAHVIEDAHRVTVTLQDDTRFQAAVVGMDENTDIAVLKINAQGLIPAEFGDSDLLRVGDEVAVIGNPLGHLHTMTTGIISALDRDIVYDGITMRLIQTNAAINEGNSGGPLINLYGQVVGITNMKLVGIDGWGFSSVEGMGFAIPTAVLKPVVDSILAHGRVVGRPALGITVRSIDEREATELGITPGVYVQHVLENTDAFAQGLQPEDRIVALNGTPIPTSAELRSKIQTFRAEDTITLTIDRDGEILELQIRLMDADLLDF